MRTHFVALALARAAGNIIAQGLPTARPEDEGFSPERLAYIGIPDFEKGRGFGLGFAVIENQSAAATLGGDGVLYWGGAADTSFWIDPKEDIVVIAMTQHFSAPAAEDGSAQLRTLVYSALIGK
jgi:CubicO group peptidase (beta-lactamase class C family)